MIHDFVLVSQWWVALFFIGLSALPLSRLLFRGWWDYGYSLSKALGLAFVTYFVFVSGSLHIFPFSLASIIISSIVLFGVGYALEKIFKSNDTTTVPIRKSMLLVIGLELLFGLSLFLWSFIKAHEPAIHGLEKFMDFGFARSILNTDYFPPQDIWYAGYPINYYYFGHISMALLSTLSGVDLTYGFNIMLAALFAFTFTMSFSIGVQLQTLIKRKKHNSTVSSESHPSHHNKHMGSEDVSIRSKLAAGFLTAFLVSLSGNMQTIYAFTKGYVGEDVVPFWTVFWSIPEFFTNLREGLERYWYANATRFIPFTIHEFPSYSFVVSDIHGHVLSLPYALLMIAFLIQVFTYWVVEKEILKKRFDMILLIFYSLLCGMLLMTNALDGPIYFMCFLFLFILVRPVFPSFQWILSEKSVTDKFLYYLTVIASVALGVVLTVLPFLIHFKSFVTGLAVNCPPEFLAGMKFGPILFETVDKCQKSPLWMLLVLWGFFWFTGLSYIIRKMNLKLRTDSHHVTVEFFPHISPTERILIGMFGFSVLLIVFPEFFYFKDIYPAHFRSNTMFKLGYQAFMMYSIISAFVIMRFFETFRQAFRKDHLKRTVFLLLLLPQLFFVSIYPIFSVRSYFGGLKQYIGLDGLLWFNNQYPADYVALQWFQAIDESKKRQMVLLEADGDSYTDYNHMSAFTGIPSVIGWAVHEWLWRGTYDVVAPRREDVRKMYEEASREETRELLSTYNVTHILIGTIEREKYKNLNEEKLKGLGKIELSENGTYVIDVSGTL